MVRTNFVFFGALIAFAGLNTASAQIDPKQDNLSDSNARTAWVDSVYRSLSRRERLAQLFFVRAHTDKGKAYEDSIAHVIEKEKIGGLVFFQGGPKRQYALMRTYQSKAKTPLMIAIDAEWGLGMRLDSTISYPYQLSLGAIQDNTLLFKMGQQVALDFRLMGMHLNFAPVADINNNPRNPVIGYRSFGDNKYNVTAKALQYMKGMQAGGILTSLKHFPGHGDTEVDSHKDLPVLTFGRERLDSLELYPFRELIKAGASGIMVAHMNIPSLDSTPNLPSTLSHNIVTGLLKQELGFKGLVMSDAMEMKGVVKFFPNGQADVMAVQAGNDIIELSENSHRAVKMVRKAIRHREIPKQQVIASVKKILAAKFDAGLAQNPSAAKPMTGQELQAKLYRKEATDLVQQLADASLTVLKSDTALKAFTTAKRTAIVCTGITELTAFEQEAKVLYPNSTVFILSKLASSVETNKLSKELKAYDQVVLAVHDYRKRPGSVLDYNTALKLFIPEVAAMNTICCLFANPYTLAGLPGTENSKCLVVAYQNDLPQFKAMSKLLRKEIGASGKLPVSVNSFFKFGDGINYIHR